MLRWGLALLAGCGRIGFESTEGGVGVDAPRDGSGDGGGDGGEIDAIDAPPGQMMTFTFGEAPITMFKTVTRDTYVSNETGEPMFNYGADNQVRIEADENERALLAFDISAIPATATIISASFQITVTQIPPVPLPIELHRVLEQWDEGNQSGSDGVTNYVIRTGAIPWQNPGAGTPVSSSATFTTFTPAMGLQSVPVPQGMVQAWVANASSNSGIVMAATSTDSTRWTTSEGTPSSARPVLTVTFAP